MTGKTTHVKGLLKRLRNNSGVNKRRRRPRARKLICEGLEDRWLLAVDILGVSSPHDSFRFIAGNDMPAVLNTYSANIDESGGSGGPDSLHDWGSF